MKLLQWANVLWLVKVCPLVFLEWLWLLFVCVGKLSEQKIIGKAKFTKVTAFTYNGMSGGMTLGVTKSGKCEFLGVIVGWDNDGNIVTSPAQILAGIQGEHHVYKLVQDFRLVEDFD